MTGPTNTDVAKYVLANSNFKFGTPMPVAMPGAHHLSILNRIVDILSRPNYAIANAADAIVQHHNPLSAAVRGLEGVDKTTFSTVFRDMGIQSKVVQGIGGFIADIALDPTTYIGAGTIGKGLGKLAEKTGVTGSRFAEGLKTAKELPIKPSVPSEITNLSEFFKGNKKASPEQISTIKNAAEVVPSAATKPKPLPNLSSTEQALAENAVGTVLKRTAKTKAKINIKAPETVNPNQQLLLWKNLLQEAKDIHPKNPAKQFDTAYRMLIHSEGHLESIGKQLRYWDGSNLKLSDIISELHTGKGVKFTREVMPLIAKDLQKTGSIRYSNPDVAQALHNVRVRGALLDSEPVKKAVEAVLHERSTLGEATASDAHLQKLFQALPALAQRHAVESGASIAAADSANKLVRDTVKAIDNSGPQGAISSVSKLIEKQLASGDTINASRINAPITSSLLDKLDIPTSEFHSPLGDRGGVYETFMGRLFSWYGQKDLRPLTEEKLLTATNSAWLRAAAIKKITENTSREDQLYAIRYAQGLENNPTPLGLQFKTALENLFRGSGLTPTDWKGRSVVGRSGMLMDRLNKHLAQNKLPYRFTDGKVKNPITGGITDYSRDAHWLTSWRSWDIKEPTEFFAKLFSAVEQSAHEKALLDEIAARFGSPVRGNGYSINFSHPYLNGYYFTQDIAKQIPLVLRDLDTFFSSGANSPFLKLFDKISRAWKFTVTMPNPSHHIHNLLGDAYMTWMAGIRSVIPYRYSAQVMRTQRNLYKDLNDLETLVATDAIPRAMGKTPDPKEILFENKTGQGFTAEQIYVAANKMGILPQAHVVEDILGDNSSLTRFRPFGGKVRAKLEHFSETREHFARLAHFIGVIQKSRGNDFEAIFRKAGYEVRKWHPDYLTLTPFEKKFMRRIMPFYSWTRKAIPLMIESIVMSPGKTLAYPKFMQAMQTMNGVDASRGDPFPGDQLFPQWLRDRGIGPIFKEPRLGARSEPPGYTIVNPSNPLYDLFGQFSNPMQGIGQMLTPAIRIPMELLTNKQLFNNAPINNVSEYIGNQLPYFPTIQSITGITPTGGLTTRAQKGQQFNTERFVNWLTSLGVRGTGPFIKEAQFEQKGVK